MKSSINRIIDKMKIKNVQKNVVVSINTVNKFEEKTNITLPEELVLFYTQICNGCKMIDGFNLLRIEDWECNLEHVKKEFQFENYLIWEDDYDEEKVKAILDGNIELIDIGDAQTWNIIVKGKQKGRMWFFTDVGIQPCAPSMNFLEWFEFWLDGNDDYFYDFIP
ncbi:MAG: SMI1/KNR4 family protein [Lachnospiraceae bacterium]|nr:SMI1/KNR4 family protein [Lachnospiraceae bacterium]